MVFGTATTVLFIEVVLIRGVLIRGAPLSLFQGVLIRGVPLPLFQGVLIRGVPLPLFQGVLIRGVPLPLFQGVLIRGVPLFIWWSVKECSTHRQCTAPGVGRSPWTTHVPQALGVRGWYFGRRVSAGEWGCCQWTCGEDGAEREPAAACLVEEKAVSLRGEEGGIGGRGWKKGGITFLHQKG